MGRSGPDFGIYAAKEVTAPLADMGEVAARLGSIVTYDKRGDVVDFDNFEEPILKWLSTIAGAGSAAYLDSDSAASGCQSVKLLLGSILSADILLRKDIAILGSTALGLEASFAHTGYNGYLYFKIWYRSGTAYYEASVRIDNELGIFYILDSTDNWKQIATNLFPYGGEFTYNTTKLVADFTTGYWKRLLFNNTEFDLSSEALYSVPDTSTPEIVLTLEVENKFADSNPVWLDDVIWTQAEP